MNFFKTIPRLALDAADSVCAVIGSGTSAPGSLLTVLFHSIHRTRADAKDPSLAPCQNITVDDLRGFLHLMLERGHTPVSPAQVDAGLEPGRNYLMLTFDDGYFNNTAALDVLEQFRAPATFFISTDHVLEHKGFWWDALNRELAARGVSEGARKAEVAGLKSWSNARIETWMRERFGADVLKPRSDLDRPFTPSELRDFARNPWVHLGNHTCSHAILTRCSRQEAAREIEGCQAALQELTGQRPIVIAYPNGDYSRAAVRAAEAAGLRLGVTVRPFQSHLPLASTKSRMTLGRFMLSGDQSLQRQCRKISSGFVPSYMIKTLIRSTY